MVKNLPANARDPGDMSSIPVSGISPGGGNDNPLQYSCLENSTDRGAWRATVQGVAKESDVTEHARTSIPLPLKILGGYGFNGCASYR